MTDADGAGSGAPARDGPVPGTDRPLLRGLGVLAAVLAVYYAAPIGWAGSLAALASGVLIVVGGAGVLTWLILGQVRRLLSTPADQMARLHTLVLVVYVIVPTFALGYFALARAADGQFHGLATKTDALYFTLTTLATVGFGDVVATGQIGRVLVSFQIVFNLVIVATAGSILASQLRGRLERTGQPHLPPPNDPSPTGSPPTEPPG